ncbi:MAG: SpoIIE family protein phosphatase [Candidatus Zixiibacteriota bacterium]
MNWRIVIAVFYLLLGTALWLLGTVIFRENPRNRVNRVTGLMLFFGGLGPLLAAIGTAMGPAQEIGAVGTQPAYYNLFYIWELFFPQLLLFAFVFPQEHPWVTRFRRAKFLIFAPHIFHFLWVTLFSRPDLSWMDVETESQLMQTVLVPVNLALGFIAFSLALLFEFHLKFFSIINLLYILVAIVALRYGFHRLSNKRLREQVRVILLGILSAVGLYAIAFIAPALGLFALPSMLRVALTILALMIGSAAIAWAIIRYQFLDTRFIVRQSLVFSISSALLLGVYLLLITQASSFIKNVLEVQTPLVDVAFVILVLLFFQPVKDRVDDLVQRIFLRDKADPRAILETFSREVTSVFDLDRLKQQMVGILTTQLFIERAFFASRVSGGGYLLDIAGLPREPFPEDDGFFPMVRERARPAPFEEFVIDRPQTAVTEVLSRWGCRLVVPIIDRGGLTAILFLGEKVSGYRYSAEDVQLLGTLANQLAVALTNAVLYQEALEKQKLEEELNVARQIQMQLLPRRLPSGTNFEVAAFTHPSQQVGGDYYDFLSLPNGNLGMVIADISGKGVGAAILASQLQATLRAEARSHHTLDRVIANTNVLIADSTGSERFATLVYAEFDPATCHLWYCNAGHNYPIILRQDGSHELLSTGGLLLGVSRTATYEVGKIELCRDDLVLFYTDGLSEIQSPDGEEFGENRLLEFLAGHRHLAPDDIKNRLVREATQFSLGAIGFDDMTMIVMKVCERGGPESALIV